VSIFVPWIKCIKKNAEAGYSHTDVDRNCYYTVGKLYKNNKPVPFNFPDQTSIKRVPLTPNEKCKVPKLTDNVEL